MSKHRIAKAKASVSAKETEELRTGKKALSRKLRAKEQTSSVAFSEAEESALLRILGVLETGFLAVIADGVLHQAEFRNLGVNFAAWLEQDVSADDLGEVLAGFADHLEEDGLEGRLEYLAEALDENSRDVAYGFACMLVACDGSVTGDELGVLARIAGAFGIPAEDAKARFLGIVDLVAQSA